MNKIQRCKGIYIFTFRLLNNILYFCNEIPFFCNEKEGTTNTHYMAMQDEEMIGTRKMAMQNKHEAVYRLYVQYRDELQRENPLMASHLPILYYAEVISRRPEICLSVAYVHKIIRKMTRLK